MSRNKGRGTHKRSHLGYQCGALPKRVEVNDRLVRALGIVAQPGDLSRRERRMLAKLGEKAKTPGTTPRG